MKAQDSFIRDGMRIEWDVPIAMDDGLALRADVFLPVAEGRYPAILSYGPYGKGLAFQEGYKSAWEIMAREHPDAVSGTTNKYANWEVVDPEKWVPDGYACVRVDSRGAGRSPGYLCHNNARETRDIHRCVEWAAAQPWCSGKVGMNGISYYASNQWRAAASQPPHLAAICVWEGWCDSYRDGNRHGGIITTFRKNWQEMQVKTVQHGQGERGAKSRVTGELVCGPETLSPEELAKKRENMWAELLGREMDGPYYRERTADLSKVNVPLLSAANWGGQGLHTRGNFEGLMGAASKQKWLEVHGGSHWAPFYTDYGVALQKRFFDRFLKGIDNGWDRQPRVLLNVRHPGEKFVPREENEWPLARTQWTRFRLDPSDMSLTTAPVSASGSAQKTFTLAYDAMGEGLSFSTPPLEKETEITGPSALKLFISSSTVGRKGSAVPGGARSAHAGRAGLAARFAPHDRSEALAAFPSVPHARAEAAAQARENSRARRRDLADLRRRAGRLAHRAHRPGQGLRAPGRGGDAVEHEEPHEGLRPLPPRRPRRPAAGGLRRKNDLALRAGAPGLPAFARHSAEVGRRCAPSSFPSRPTRFRSTACTTSPRARQWARCCCSTATP